MKKLIKSPPHIFLLLIITVVVFFVGMKVSHRDDARTAAVHADTAKTFLFVCKDDKKILASFGADSVILRLDNKREILLPQAMSASGARYANADESLVFWNKGDTAFFEENGKGTFTDCVVSK